MNKIEFDALLERYLNNELNQAEITRFETLVNENEEFRSAFKKKQKVIESLKSFFLQEKLDQISVSGNSNELQVSKQLKSYYLKEQLDELHQEFVSEKVPKRTNRIWLVAASVSALLLTSIFVFNNLRESSPTDAMGIGAEEAVKRAIFLSWQESVLEKEGQQLTGFDLNTLSKLYESGYTLESAAIDDTLAISFTVEQFGNISSVEFEGTGNVDLKEQIQRNLKQLKGFDQGQYLLLVPVEVKVEP